MCVVCTYHWKSLAITELLAICFLNTEAEDGGLNRRKAKGWQNRAFFEGEGCINNWAKA